MGWWPFHSHIAQCQHLYLIFEKMHNPNYYFRYFIYRKILKINPSIYKLPKFEAQKASYNKPLRIESRWGGGGGVIFGNCPQIQLYDTEART